MKTWNVPSLEELDVRMTANGNVAWYYECEECFKELGGTGDLHEGTIVDFIENCPFHPVTDGES